jgi:hypothetical protein
MPLRCIANPGPLGIMDPCPGIHYYLFPYFTPKNLPQHPAKVVAGLGRRVKQGFQTMEPQVNKKFRMGIIEPGVVPLIQAEEGHLSALGLL